jgi:hypothetical protein
VPPRERAGHRRSAGSDSPPPPPARERRSASHILESTRRQPTGVAAVSASRTRQTGHRSVRTRSTTHPRPPSGPGVALERDPRSRRRTLRPRERQTGAGDGRLPGPATRAASAPARRGARQDETPSLPRRRGASGMSGLAGGRPRWLDRPARLVVCRTMDGSAGRTPIVSPPRTPSRPRRPRRPRGRDPAAAPFVDPAGPAGAPRFAALSPRVALLIGATIVIGLLL